MHARALKMTAALAVPLASLLSATSSFAQVTQGVPRPPTESPRERVGQQERGFAIYADMTAMPSLFSIGGFSEGSLEGGVFLGYKYQSVVMGVGFDMTNISLTTGQREGGRTTESKISEMSFSVSPGLQVALARSRDQRVELFGALHLSLGSATTSVEGAGRAEDAGGRNGDSHLHLGYRVGPGVRYWAHPNFALSVLSGAGGDYLIDAERSRAGTTTSIGVSGVFTSIGVLGVF